MAANLEQIGTRLRFFMKIKGMDIFALGEFTNTSAILISNIIAGKNYCMDDLLSVLNNIPELNPHWVIYGEGNIFKSETTPADTDTATMQKNRLKHLQEMQQLLETLDAIEKSKENKSQIDNLKARITELTRKL
ncbi:hypothetical protein AAE02nite_10650 [Adhaeribacter aerolatus]|uniref:HTH cro/C1-type domain-containing protein n=1 Tax=Adhaeribacter aerolatus TaxID=670289 RepID=A0A512AUL7_9BACT|nr:hypothetical protein [Adhaeribacter aerolatus]GEO03401.1 hypothetical protein AAE02nite_10650 [Adhaeribacter aerolatus]